MKYSILTFIALILVIGTTCAQTEKNTQSCGKVTDREGHTYNTIQIGTQCWMKENMRTEYDRKGNHITDNESKLHDAMEIHCPENSTTNVEKYGFLYNLEAAKNICPKGWHLPTVEEFVTLINYCSENYASDKLKVNNAKPLAAAFGWRTDNGHYTIGNHQENNNLSGFSAMPAGYYSAAGAYCEGFLTQAYFWTSTQTHIRPLTVYENRTTYIFNLSSYHSEAFMFCFGHPLASCSVRCIKD